MGALNGGVEKTVSVEKSKSLNVLKIEILQSNEIYEANKTSIIVSRQTN